MKALFQYLIFLTTLILAANAAAAGPSSPQTSSRGRIGVYDSRAIAVAYAGSPSQRAMLAPLLAARQKAKQDGDQAELARLEAHGKALQDKAHQQAFSTAPVDDLLEFIAAALPEIRRTANVTSLISIWDENALSRHAGAERVDVTSALVDAFQPTEKQRKVSEEIRKMKPLPLDKVRDGRK